MKVESLYKTLHSLKCIYKCPPFLFRLQCVNSLWSSDAIWQHRSGSPLAQVMACCLTAPSHYLNQCWLSLVRFCGIHLRAIQQRAPKYLFYIISLKIRLSKLLPLFPGANELKTHPDSSGVANDCVFTGDICGTGGRRVQSCQLQRIGYCCEKMDPTLTGRTTG